MFNDELKHFDELTNSWSGILIGNGASQAVSQGFAYGSLFEKAKSNEISHALGSKDIKIFEQLATGNFEQVLSALAQSKTINEILELDQQSILDAYGRIQESLIEAVHGVHIQWKDIPEETLLAIRDTLLSYDYVYSTNYDLLIYWSVMKNTAGFKDYFFGDAFDLGNTEIWDKCTKLLFLHGGLHLYRYKERTIKRKAGISGNLIGDFGDPIRGEAAIPLFITEGTSEDKRRSIYSNDY